MRVDIYRNLHKKGITYSVRDSVSKRVLFYTSNITLKDVSFLVNPKGRERVLKEKRKNVHAFIRGTVDTSGGTPSGKLITYNPYKSDKFYLKNNENKKLQSADKVFIHNGKIKGIGIIFIPNDSIERNPQGSNSL
jgi:hypothetical protein